MLFCVGHLVEQASACGVRPCEDQTPQAEACSTVSRSLLLSFGDQLLDAPVVHVGDID